MQLGLQISRIRKRVSNRQSVFTAFDKTNAGAVVVIKSERAPMLDSTARQQMTSPVMDTQPDSYDALADRYLDGRGPEGRPHTPNAFTGRHTHTNAKLAHTRSDVEFVDGRHSTSSLGSRSTRTPESVGVSVEARLDGRATPVTPVSVPSSRPPSLRTDDLT